MKRISLSEKAKKDLRSGFEFYENQLAGLGAYFIESITAEIDSLKIFAGIHKKYKHPYHVVYAKHFPFAIYYLIDNKEVLVEAVLDTRRDPKTIAKRVN